MWISEIQFDISETFSNTLNIHLCHPHIYSKLQKTTYQVLLYYENITVNQYLLSPPNFNKPYYSVFSLPNKESANCRFLMDHSHTHIHTHSIRSNSHCPLYTKMSCQWLVGVHGHSEAAKTNGQTESFMWEYFLYGILIGWKI